MTRYDTARIDAARANLASCRAALAKLEAERDEYAHVPTKAAKLAPQLAGAAAALDAAEREWTAAQAAPPVPFVEPTENVRAYAGHAAGTGTAGSAG